MLVVLVEVEGLVLVVLLVVVVDAVVLVRLVVVVVDVVVRKGVVRRTHPGPW